MVDGGSYHAGQSIPQSTAHPAVVGLFAHFGGVGHHSSWFVHDLASGGDLVATLAPRAGASSELQFAMTQQQFLVNRGWVGGVNQKEFFHGLPRARGQRQATLVLLLADGSIPTRPPWRRCQHTTASGNPEHQSFFFCKGFQFFPKTGVCDHAATDQQRLDVGVFLPGSAESAYQGSDRCFLKRCRGIRALAQRVTQAPGWWFLADPRPRNARLFETTERKIKGPTLEVWHGEDFTPRRCRSGRLGRPEPHPAIPDPTTPRLCRRPRRRHHQWFVPRPCTEKARPPGTNSNAHR